MTGLLYLSWNNHNSSFGRKLISLHEKNLYCDCTIVCEDKFYPAHKFVLSTCSEYFEEIFEKAVTTCEYPFVVLKDISPIYLELLFSYMYSGGVSISYDNLSGLVVAAESLRIKGLAVPDGSDAPETRNFFSNLERKRHISSSDCNSTIKKVKCSDFENSTKLASNQLPLEANIGLHPNTKVPHRKLCSIPISPETSNKVTPELSPTQPLRTSILEPSSSLSSNKMTSSGFSKKSSSSNAINKHDNQNAFFNNLCPASLQKDPSCYTTFCCLPKPISSDLESTSREQVSRNQFDLEGIKVKVETSEPKSRLKGYLKVKPSVELEELIKYTDGNGIDNFSSTQPLQEDRCFLPQFITCNNERNENFGWPFSDLREHEIQIKEEPIGNYVSFFKTDDLSETFLSEKLNYSHKVQLDIASRRRRKVIKRRGRCRSSSSHSYKCSLCNSSFASKSNVRFHVVTVHEKVTSYPCPRCDSVFSQRGNFKTHFNTVHLNIRPFECSICEAVFSQKGNLKSHYSKKHNLEMTDLELSPLKDDYSANISNNI